MKLAKKKYEILLRRNLEPKELKMKLISFLISKGFDYDLVREICANLLKNNSEEFDN